MIQVKIFVCLVWFVWLVFWRVFDIWSDIFLVLLLVNQQKAPTQIDNGISQAIKEANKISMSKNIFGDNRIKNFVTAEKTSIKRNTVDISPNYGYFKQQPCDYSIDKEKMPENSIIYMNQDINLIRIMRKFTMRIIF